MKKTFTLLAVFAIALCASCSKDQEIETEDKIVPGEEQIGEGVTQFTASIPETKTYLDGPHGEAPHRTWNNFWSVGDAVNVNGVNSKGLEDGSEYIGSDSAVFEMDSPVSGDYYYAVYPSSAVPVDGYNSSTHVHTVNIGATQNFVVDSYDPAAYLMTVKSDTPRLTLNPMMGLIQLTTNGPKEGLYIKSISVESVGDEKLTGSFTTNADHTAITGGSGKQITISAPAGTTKPFGTVFTFAVPAQYYASGIRFRITATTDDKGTEGEQTMVFAKQSAFNVTAGTLYPLTAPAFKASNITLDCTFKTSSSAGFEWSAANASNNVKKVWRLAIYSDSGCNTLVVQHDIPADESTDGIWKDQGETLGFIVGGLTQGTNYWCKVTDLANDISNVVAFTTDAFTTVQASSPSGTTLVAEDFSEIGWGPAFLGGYEGHRYAGWSPVNAASARNEISFAAPSGVVTNGCYKSYDFGVNNVNTNLDYSTVTRLRDGWGWFWEGEDFNGYPQPGFLRMGAKNASRSFVVAPALSIADGKYATVAVTVKISHMVSSDDNYNPDFGVFKETNLTLSDATRREYTGAVLQHAYPLTSSVYGFNKDELTFTVNGVKNTDHLVLGLYKNVENRNRYNLYSVTIQRVGDEYGDEIFDITDAASLVLFNSRVVGATSLKGNVINNVDASTIASTWTPIAGYTGTLEGNSKTITGLTQPFFADLQGTVRYLTLDSTINWEDDVEGSEGPAIFAEELKGGGSMDNCTSKGSVTFCPSTAVTNATRYVAGLVGYVSDGTVTDCSNDASVSFPHNDQDNDMIINVGGAIGGINSATSFSNISNSGNVSVGVINATSTAREGRIGGVVGYIPNASSISSFNNSGEIEFTGTTTGSLSIGGIVGRTAKAISSCENRGAINAGGAMTGNTKDYYRYVGGIAGFVSANVTLTDNVNTSSATITNSGSSGYYSLVGGISGYPNGVISGGSNAAAINYSGYSAATVCVGGIAGRTPSGKTGTRINNVTNSGNISVTESSSHAGKTILVGGVSAHHQSGDVLAHNSGTITVKNMHCSTMEVGGLCGQAGNKDNDNIIHTASILANSNNAASGDISVSGLETTGTCYIGGLVGKAYGSITSATNAGDVEFSSSTCTSYLFVGGLAGRVEAVSGMSISSSSNSGEVTNSASSGGGKDVCVGGLAGFAQGISISSSHNTNTAAVSNSGNAACDLCVGGLVGNCHTTTVTGCYNAGSVTNAGNAASGKSVALGGLVGWSTSCTYGPVCYNTGAISNTGAGSKYPAGLALGGLLGYAGGDVAHTLSGTSSSYNYNEGTVTDNSSSANPCVGGICGYAAETAADFTYCANRSVGTITVKNGSSRNNVCVGGILGCAETSVDLTTTSNAGAIKLESLSGVNCLNVGGILGLAGDTAVPDISGSDGSHLTSNSGNIEFKTCSISGAVRVGGIIGWWDNTLESTLEYCSNIGTISTYTKKASSTDLYISNTDWNHMGGIVGGSQTTSNQSYKTIRNCNNDGGDITIYSRGKFRIGGIAGIATQPVSNCSCTADITYGRDEVADSERSIVAGVIGYYVNGSRTFTDIQYNGNVNTSGGRLYAACIIGYTAAKATFDNCSINGSVSCDNLPAGLFFCSKSGSAVGVTFKNSCTVKSGTTVINSSSTTTITSASDFTQTNVVGGGGTTTTTFSNLSVN